MKLKQLSTGAALGMLLASPVAMAGSLTGNIGVVSEYVFRGVDQSGGAAVQGGVDYTFDLGLYTGVWISNVDMGNEADVYGGYALKLGDFDLTAGLIYYAFTEDTETGGNVDYAELFVGGAFGPVALKVFYANEYGADPDPARLPPGGTATQDSDEAMYVTASGTLTLTDTISIIPQVGFSSGDGVKDAYGDEYMDYSITATKRINKEDLTLSLAVVATDIDDMDATTPGDQSDNPKFVLGLKKGFKL